MKKFIITINRECGTGGSAKMKKTLLILILALVAMGAQAQVASEEIVNYGKRPLPLQPDFNAKWSIGIKMGPNWTSISQSNSGRIDETFSPLMGIDAGLQAKYAFTDWLAVRADLTIMSRSYRMDRNLHYLDPVYTKYSNDYLMLPLMADFSFGGKKLQGHAYAGGFGSFWMKARMEGKTYWMTDYYVYFEDFKEQRAFNSEDQRLVAGAVGGLGLSYAIFGANQASPVISLDVLYYYDLVSHHKGYPHLSDPRYLNTLSITLGLSASF